MPIIFKSINTLQSACIIQDIYCICYNYQPEKLELFHIKYFSKILTSVQVSITLEIISGSPSNLLQLSTS